MAMGGASTKVFYVINEYLINIYLVTLPSGESDL